MKATITNYRQSPQKVRLVADAIRGKSVTEARELLEFTPNKSARQFLSLLNSAVANAENNFKVSKDDLYIETLQVDKGITLKRFRARARGSASRINKRSSNIKLELAITKKPTVTNA